MDYVTKNVIATSIFVIIALTGYFYTPKSRNAFGYKTPMSLKNDLTWNYANNLVKKLFILVLIIFVIMELIFYEFMESERSAYKYSFLAFAILSVLIIPVVEIMLNNKFDKNGNLKN